MGRQFQAKGIIPGQMERRGGDGIIDILRLIKETHDASCGGEPIILVGYSRGGAAVQAILGYLSIVRPDIEVDLALTIGPVHYNMHIPPPKDVMRPNVKRHINFISEQAYAAVPPTADDRWPMKIPLPGLDEFRISGAENIDCPGTHHFSVAEQPMKIFEIPYNPRTGIKGSRRYVRSEDPSPVWTRFEHEIRNLSPLI
jgi:hypothetical protein